MESNPKINIEQESLSDRHRAILDILQLQGSVSVSDLSERLSVSEVTIRKDLSTLEKQNKLPGHQLSLCKTALPTGPAHTVVEQN